MAVITISREMGSGGKTIAKRVADHLGYDYFDKGLVIELARELGVSEASVEQFDEQDGASHGFRTWMRALFQGPDPIFTSSMPPPYWPTLADPSIGHQPNLQGEHILDRDEYLDMLNVLINRLKERDQVVIVGRGGQCLLANDPNARHFRIVAPFEVRCDRVLSQKKLSVEDGKELVKQSDQTRAHYLKKRYGTDWDDPMLYHLVINTGRCSLEQAARLIINTVQIG